MKRASLLFALLALPPIAGCSQWDTGNVAKRSLAAALDCPEVRVEMSQEGAYRYRGEGCGRESVVVCSASRLEPQCLAMSDTSGGEREPPMGPDEEAPPADRADDEPAERSVLTDTADADVESQIRAGLDARSEDVLACTGRDRVAVRAGYAPDGSVAFSLQGPLRGTPEEGCVQDVLDGVRVAATGEAAVVIHLVRHLRRATPPPSPEPAPRRGSETASEPAPETEPGTDTETDTETEAASGPEPEPRA